MKPAFTWAVTCDSCGWAYPPPGRGTVAVKTDCEAHARAHRQHGCRHAGQAKLSESA